MKQFLYADAHREGKVGSVNGPRAAIFSVCCFLVARCRLFSDRAGQRLRLHTSPRKCSRGGWRRFAVKRQQSAAVLGPCAAGELAVIGEAGFLFLLRRSMDWRAQRKCEQALGPKPTGGWRLFAGHVIQGGRVVRHADGFVGSQTGPPVHQAVARELAAPVARGDSVDVSTICLLAHV